MSCHLSQSVLFPPHTDLNLLLLSSVSASLFSSGFVFISKLTSSLVFPHRSCVVLFVGQSVIISVTKSLDNDTVSVRSEILLTLETQSSSCGESILEKSGSSHWLRPRTQLSKCKAAVVRRGPVIPLGLLPLKFPRQSPNRSQESLIMACRASDMLRQTAQGHFRN